MKIEQSIDPIEKSQKLVAYLRDLADQVEARGVVYVDVDENCEVIETAESNVIRTYRHGPRLWLQITLDWSDIPEMGKGESDRSVKH